MKKIYYLLFLLLGLASCIEDNGNYEYTTLKEAKISGLNDSYRFVLQQPTVLKPTITTDIDAANLEYCWRISNDTLSKEKDLSYTFVNTLTSSNLLIFEVIDKSNRVRYTKRMNVTVVSPFQTGWLMLGSVAEKPVLSFQSYEEGNTYYPDVYNTVNKESLSGTPNCVKQLIYQDGLTGGYYSRVTAVCNNGKSVDLDGTSMLRQLYLDDQYKGEGSFSIGAISSERYSIDNALFVINNGKIYEKTLGNVGVTPEDGYFEYPLDGDSKGYKVCNYYGIGWYGDYYLTADVLNKRYVYFSRSSLSTKVSPLIVGSSSIKTIDSDNLEGDPVWMGMDYKGEVLSVLKTNAGKYILHKMSFTTYDGTVTFSGRYEFPDGVINENSCFVGHAVNPYLMISNGNKLMALNLEALDAGASALNDICTYEGPITAMHYSYDKNRNVNEFGLAIQANSSSSSLLIISTSLIDKGAVLKRYDNIAGKVVSLWRKIM